MDNLGFPFRPVHPGELLKDELEYRHLSQKAVAKQLGVPYSALNETLNGKRPVTTTTAMLFEAALGIPAYMLVGMQTDYNLQVATKDKTLAQRLERIRKIAATRNAEKETTYIESLPKIMQHTHCAKRNIKIGKRVRARISM
jgi:addiction module HigA family antidote